MQMRIKQPGMRWRKAGAGDVLALRYKLLVGLVAFGRRRADSGHLHGVSLTPVLGLHLGLANVIPFSIYCDTIYSFGLRRLPTVIHDAK
jgi:hypothetical protein